MQDSPPDQSTVPARKPDAKADRAAREAAALRANLHKRKQQARAREQQAEPPKQD